MKYISHEQMYKLDLALKLLRKDRFGHFRYQFIFSQMSKKALGQLKNEFLSFIQDIQLNHKNDEKRFKKKKSQKRNLQETEYTKMLDQFEKSMATDIDIQEVKHLETLLTKKDTTSITKRMCWFMDELENLGKAMEAKLLERIEKYLLDLKSQLKSKTSPQDMALNEIKDLFKLTELEVDVLRFIYVVNTDKYLENIFEESGCRIDRKSRFITEYSNLFDTKVVNLKKILRKSAILYKAQLIEETSRFDRGITVSSFALEYIENPDESGLMKKFLKDITHETKLKTKDFNFSGNDIATLKSLLKHTNKPILFFGPPGTGKTEFAQALTKEVNKEAIFLVQQDEDGDENLSFRKSALTALNVRGKDTKKICIVDEADTLLKTKNYWKSDSDSDTKAWLNDFLEHNSSCPTIWITNDKSQIDDSTLRRFSYTFKFSKHGVKQRIGIINKNLSLNDISLDISAEDIENIAYKYDLNAGDIARAIIDTKNITSTECKQEFLNCLNTILENKIKIYDKEIYNQKIPKTYQPDALNLDYPLEDILHSLSKFYNHENDFIKNYNLLFHGVPGTGKSEFAQFLAQTLGKEIIIKKGSDLLDPYVGMTERHIASAFEEAEQNDAILFIDEADTFFGSREQADKSWQISHVNELLNGMERYKGVMICATNFIDHLDLAAMRRFSLKVKFDFLTAQGNILMAQKWFEETLGVSLNRRQLDVLREIKNLTPGDFKTVCYKYAFQSEIDTDALITDLQSEIKLKKIKKGISL